ncbi:conserved hypothetical protein [Ricinus communis]|uniref:Uncharacterized protein n=1 Tax=Ricinus communis TaxID=3988 RepID=B9T358_RICCO|nr:conserved hypothetical protein [Ricinus communis]
MRLPYSVNQKRYRVIQGFCYCWISAALFLVAFWWVLPSIKYQRKKDLEATCFLVSIILSAPHCCLPIYNLTPHNKQFGVLFFKSLTFIMAGRLMFPEASTIHKRRTPNSSAEPKNMFFKVLANYSCLQLITYLDPHYPLQTNATLQQKEDEVHGMVETVAETSFSLQLISEKRTIGVFY